MTTPRALGLHALGLLTLTSACASTGGGRSGGGPTGAGDSSDIAESKTALGAASARCPTATPASCACRPIDEYGRGTDPAADAESSPPPEGYKRFELRTGRGADRALITIEGLGTWEKPEGSVEPGCVYVDLPPGKHRVRYHVIASDPGQGLEPRLRVAEYGAPFQRWYRTFAFRCSGQGGGPCTKDDARDAITELSRVDKGKHDPCGSTRVQGLRFFTERPADAQVADFNLQFVLNVYKFTPRFPPDAKTCKGVSGDAGASEP